MRTQIVKSVRSFAEKELHRVIASIIISFKTKTMFRAAVETMKIASRRILLSNKKTGVRVPALARAGEETKRGEARWSEEKKRGGARARGRANWQESIPDIQRDGSRFAAGRLAPFFVCLHLHRGYTYAGRTHYFSSVPLGKTSSFIFNPSVATELSACLI